MPDITKAARIDWIMNASENDSAGWADKHAEALLSHAEATEAALAVARAALENINLKASPDPDRQLDQCSADLYWCACEARRVLTKLNGV